MEDQKYVCGECGDTSSEERECCGKNMEETCGCGTGKSSKDCCMKEENAS